MEFGRPWHVYSSLILTLPLHYSFISFYFSSLEKDGAVDY